MKENNGWISIKDKLPEKDGEMCLCVDEGIGIGTQYILILTFYFKNPEDFDTRKINYSFWKYDSEWGYCNFGDVTHWMPLPPLPNK